MMQAKQTKNKKTRSVP